MAHHELLTRLTAIKKSPLVNENYYWLDLWGIEPTARLCRKQTDLLAGADFL